MGQFDDHQMGWKVGRLYIPTTGFSGTLAGASAGAGGQEGEIAAASFAGMKMADEDDVSHLMPIPFDWDVGQDVKARVFWGSDSTDADAGTVFELTYLFFAAAATLASPTGDGTATFDAQTQGTTAGVLFTSEWQSLDFTANYDAADVLFGFKVEATVWAGTADELCLLGVEFEYTISMLTDQRKVTSVT